MSEPIDPKIQDLIDSSERLIAEAQRHTLDGLCKEMDIDPERLRAFLAQHDSPESQDQAAQAIADDQLEVQREIDAEATRRGLLRPAPRVRVRGLRV